jgi:CRISPR/Cas system CSM-associated protein Csm3 (group 7 of RAMP superfamily)
VNPPLSTDQPWSRLDLAGEFVLDTPLRIAADISGNPLCDASGQPIIPATTFRGVLRAYIESILRSLNADIPPTIRHLTVTGSDGKPQDVVRFVALCCDSTDKHPDDALYQGCLTEAIIARWRADMQLRPSLDRMIAVCSCMACRLFGTSWLAGRVRVDPLTTTESSWEGDFVPVGKKKRPAVPAGTRFRFHLSVENATFAEQGLILLGLDGFENGRLALGAERSRGLGQGHLALDWWNCRYLDAGGVIGALLGGEAPAAFTEVDVEARFQALDDWLETMRVPPETPAESNVQDADG